MKNSFPFAWQESSESTVKRVKEKERERGEDMIILFIGHPHSIFAIDLFDILFSAEAIGGASELSPPTLDTALNEVNHYDRRESQSGSPHRDSITDEKSSGPFATEVRPYEIQLRLVKLVTSAAVI